MTIPDNGILHGAYRDATGDLRLLDAGQNPRPDETAVDWAQGLPAPMWAAVNRDGTLRRGSPGVISAPNPTPNTPIGLYRVTFPQPVTDRVWVATFALDDPGGISDAGVSGVISVQGGATGLTTSQLIVRTATTEGVPTDGPFHLVVI